MDCFAICVPLSTILLYCWHNIQLVNFPGLLSVGIAPKAVYRNDLESNKNGRICKDFHFVLSIGKL